MSDLPDHVHKDEIYNTGWNDAIKHLEDEVKAMSENPSVIKRLDNLANSQNEFFPAFMKFHFIEIVVLALILVLVVFLK